MTCPNCDAAEVASDAPRTTYACGSSDYDQRPGTFLRVCAVATRDAMPCGCFWKRLPGVGDVLTQCAAHAAGAKHDGSDPMTPEEAEDFASGLSKALGVPVKVITK